MRKAYTMAKLLHKTSFYYDGFKYQIIDESIVYQYESDTVLVIGLDF